MTFRERVGKSVSVWTWVAGLTLLGVAVLHLILGEQEMLVVWMHTFVGWLGLPTAPVLAVAAIRRKPAQCVPPGLTLLLWLSWVFPPIGADDTTGGRPLRITSSNVLMVNADVRPLVAEALASAPDILLFQEFTPEAQQALAGTDWVTRLERPAVDSYGLALYARFPLVDAEWVDLAGVDWLRAVLDVDGQEVEVWNVHTLAPYKPFMHEGWLVQVEILAEQAARVERPLIVAGDLNLTPFHPAYDKLTGPLQDAYVRCGRWGAWTWPANGHILPWLPKVRIDHVLLRGPLRCASIREGVGSGSDHRPIVAELLLDR